MQPWLAWGFTLYALNASATGNEYMGDIFTQNRVTTQLALGSTVLGDMMHRRTGSSGVVRACIQLAASSRSRLPHNLAYTFITNVGSFSIRMSYKPIGLSKASDRFLCSLSSLFCCSEVFANKKTKSVLKSRCRSMQTMLPRVYS